MLRLGIYKVLVFHEGSGKSPYLDWLSALDLKTQERILNRVTRLEKGQFGDCKTIDKNLYELRFFFGPGYRIYFGVQHSKLVLLLTGGDKSSQNKDILKAKQFWKTFQEDTHD